jgi:hypothetical protein
MPVRIGAHAWHAPHDQRLRQADFVAGIDRIGMFCQELAKRRLRRQQRRGKVTAFEITPGKQDVLGIDVRRFGIVATTRHAPAGNLWRACAVTVVQDLVRDVVREIKFESLGLVLQRVVQIHDIRRVKE